MKIIDTISQAIDLYLVCFMIAILFGLGADFSFLSNDKTLPFGKVMIHKLISALSFALGIYFIVKLSRKKAS